MIGHGNISPAGTAPRVGSFGNGHHFAGAVDEQRRRPGAQAQLEPQIPQTPARRTCTRPACTPRRWFQAQRVARFLRAADPLKRSRRLRAGSPWCPSGLSGPMRIGQRADSLWSGTGSSFRRAEAPGHKTSARGQTPPWRHRAPGSRSGRMNHENARVERFSGGGRSLQVRGGQGIQTEVCAR